MSGTGGSMGARSSSASISSSLPDWLRNVVVGTGAQRHDHRGEAVDIGDDDDPHRGIELAQLLDQLELITTAERRLTTA